MEIMVRKTIISTLILLALFAGDGFSQQREIKKADVKFKIMQYNEAAELYRKAITKFEEDNRQKEYAIFKLAECHRLMHNPDSAEVLYSELAEGSFGNIYSDLYLRYADILRMEGKTGEARKYYKKYLKMEQYSKEAKQGLASCDWIEKNEMNRARAKVNIAAVLNSAYDDFSPSYLSDDQDKIVFTSNREISTGKHIDQWSGHDFSDLFESSLINEQWTAPVLLQGGENVNTASHEGTPELNAEHDAMYFTRCVRMRAMKKFCRIMKSEKSAGIWQEPVEAISDTASNTGHPAVSSDELMIIFSSGREGTKGEKDLWIARRKSKDEDFGRPVNLGSKVNTFGNEMFPFIYRDSLLLFASDGHPGYGGLDIYKCVLKGNTCSEPVNLLSPVNSGYDDFRLITADFPEEGYFTSNRPGGAGEDDIYSYTRRDLVFTIAGHVSDKETLLSLGDADIFLINEDLGDTIYSATGPKGRFKFDTTQVIEGCDYQVMARKPNYFTAKENFSTKGHMGDRRFSTRMFLEPIPESPIVLPDILFPLDEWTLEPQYQDSLLQLVEILDDNPNLVIELRSHTDSRASLSYNDNLSQKRAQAVVDFLISKGIDPGRLVARGYGERIPRTLSKDVSKEGYFFEKGTTLDDAYVESLPTKEHREAAFHLNRRTEFAVLAKDYDPGRKKPGKTEIQIVTDTTGNVIEFEMTAENKFRVICFINDFSVNAILDPEATGSMIDESVVIELLQKGGIKRSDFSGDFEQIVQNDRIEEGSLVTLRKVRIGETIIEDAQCRVRKNGGLLLIGSDLLDKVGNFTIDKEKQVLIFN